METKLCPGCQKTKPLSSFNFKSKMKGTRQVRCRECTRQQVRSHYQRNQEYYVAKAKQRNQVLDAEQRLKILDYLLHHPCVDCGENDPICLEFDHVRGEKFKPVSEMTGNYPWRTIEAEIAKCDVRCANCHRKKTARQFGYWKL